MNYTVNDVSLIFSDHCVVSFELPHVISNGQRKHKDVSGKVTSNVSNIKWDASTIKTYGDITGVLLRQIQLPSCFDNCALLYAHSDHKIVIDKLTDDIVSYVQHAGVS